MKFVAHIAPNKQRHEGADLGVVGRGCDPVQAYVHLAPVELVGELLTHLASDTLQVCVDLGPSGRRLDVVELAMASTSSERTVLARRGQPWLFSHSRRRAPPIVGYTRSEDSFA
jgi:hypothetical protein